MRRRQVDSEVKYGSPVVTFSLRHAFDRQPVIIQDGDRGGSILQHHVRRIRQVDAEDLVRFVARIANQIDSERGLGLSRNELDRTRLRLVINSCKRIDAIDRGVVNRNRLHRSLTEDDPHRDNRRTRIAFRTLHICEAHRRHGRDDINRDHAEVGNQRTVCRCKRKAVRANVTRIWRVGDQIAATDRSERTVLRSQREGHGRIQCVGQRIEQIGIGGVQGDRDCRPDRGRHGLIDRDGSIIHGRHCDRNDIGVSEQRVAGTDRQLNSSHDRRVVIQRRCKDQSIQAGIDKRRRARNGDGVRTTAGRASTGDRQRNRSTSAGTGGQGDRQRCHRIDISNLDPIAIGDGKHEAPHRVFQHGL